jgi:hypothetical protein
VHERALALFPQAFARPYVFLDVTLFHSRFKPAVLYLKTIR